MWIKYNANPCGKNNGDCVIRAISIVTGRYWRTVYAALSLQGYIDCGWGDVNEIWHNYLLYLGFDRYDLTVNTRYTVEDFANDHPHGRYVVGTGTHAVAVVDGNVIDSWDSRKQIPKYFFVKR